MVDSFRINVDKHHKSSSSITGCVDNVRSERILDTRGSTPEIDDKFSLAEARCDDLREKIDLVKLLKRKKKIKKRSMTTIAEPVSTSGRGADNMPFISVSTQPKKKVFQQTAKLRRFEVPQNSNTLRGYGDTDVVEQHPMLNRVNAYNVQKLLKQVKTKTNQDPPAIAFRPSSHLQRYCADGEAKSERNQGVQITAKKVKPLEVACGDDELSDRTEEDVFICANDIRTEAKLKNTRRNVASRLQNKKNTGYRRRHFSKERATDTVSPQRWQEIQEPRRFPPSYHQPRGSQQYNIGNNITENDVGPLVELFNKDRPSPGRWSRQVNGTGGMKNQKVTPNKKEIYIVPSDDVITKPRKQKTNRRAKYESRRYELPTVSSQMKQAGMRYYCGDTNHSNLPFVVSKSTAPSHNVGVNIQQVLNGLKMQQPLSGIPLTIAHHMGLRHLPTFGTTNATVQPVLHNSEINVIKVGQRMVRLPSFKCMSYNRLLSLYREGEGIVPRFLRAVSRPHYFYTSMYNLATDREDFDGSTSKGRAESQEAKKNLADYANLYREYERIEKSLNDKYDPDLEKRKDDLARQLTAREDYIRKVVQEYKPDSEGGQILRASASTAEEGYRHSTFKLNSDGPK